MSDDPPRESVASASDGPVPTTEPIPFWSTFARRGARGARNGRSRPADPVEAEPGILLLQAVERLESVGVRLGPLPLDRESLGISHVVLPLATIDPRDHQELDPLRVEIGQP